MCVCGVCVAACPIYRGVSGVHRSYDFLQPFPPYAILIRSRHALGESSCPKTLASSVLKEDYTVFTGNRHLKNLACLH